MHTHKFKCIFITTCLTDLATLKTLRFPVKPKLSLKHVKIQETHEDAKCVCQQSINAKPEKLSLHLNPPSSKPSPLE